MARRATLKDVADLVGVAPSTVSRAFSRPAAIAVETRDRIHEAAERLNYAPKRRGGADGAGERRGVVGVVVAALHNAFYPYLVDQIHDALDALGYGMILIIDELSDSATSRSIEALIDQSLDGVIFTTASIDSPAVELLIARSVPTVLAIRSAGRDDVDVIESDNVVAGAEAARHLIDLGHRDIGFILGPTTTSTARDRLAGGRQAMAAAGVQFDDSAVVWSDYTHQAGYSGTVALLSRKRPPTAIVCGNDVVAIGALDACAKQGVDVPGRVSIIGFDDVPMASWAMIALTTVRQEIGDIGTLAARRIAARIEKGESLPISHDVLPTNVVVRRTTAALN